MRGFGETLARLLKTIVIIINWNMLFQHLCMIMIQISYVEGMMWI